MLLGDSRADSTLPGARTITWKPSVSPRSATSFDASALDRGAASGRKRWVSSKTRARAAVWRAGGDGEHASRQHDGR